LAVILPAAAAAASPGDEGDAVNAFLGEDYFAAGATVLLQEPVAGDALLAGGRVESHASIGGDATMAGGEVTIHATVGDDLYLAGGRVEVDALVAGNARIAGGRVRIAPETRIEGGAAITGGRVSMAGTVGRYLTLAGGDVTLGGHVGGDVRVYAGELIVQPGTRIDGRLIYRTPRPVKIPADAQIRGGSEHIAASGDSGRDYGVRWWRSENRERIGWLWLAGLALLGLLLIRVFPGFSARTTAVLTHRPWLGLGVGFAVLVCVPAATLIFFITIIGIPVALIALLLYLAMLVAAYVVGAQYLADRALAAARPAAAARTGWRLAALFVALLALALVGGLPLVGGLARFLVLLLGLGAITLAITRSPSPPAANASARPA
jgi:hypothetical protein